MLHARKFDPEYECEFCGSLVIDSGGYEEYWGASVWIPYWECPNEDRPGEENEDDDECDS